MVFSGSVLRRNSGSHKIIRVEPPWWDVAKSVRGKKKTEDTGTPPCLLPANGLHHPRTLPINLGVEWRAAIPALYNLPDLWYWDISRKWSSAGVERWGRDECLDKRMGAGWGCDSIAEHLPSLWVTLHLIPSTMKATDHRERHAISLVDTRQARIVGTSSANTAVRWCQPAFCVWSVSTTVMTECLLQIS